MFIQCELKYNDGNKAVFWIESEYAKENKRLLDEDIQKECVVEKVFRENVKTEKEMLKTERMFKKFAEKLKT